MSFAVEKFKVALRDRFLPNFLFRWRAVLNHVPDAHLYNPTFQPWLGFGEFRQLYDQIGGHTSDHSRGCLGSLFSCPADTQRSRRFSRGRRLSGWNRASAWSLLDTSGHKRTLHLFDTFGGMPGTNRLWTFTGRRIFQIPALRLFPRLSGLKNGSSITTD